MSDSVDTSKWALVTGATGGLGRAFVRELVKRGRPVMLVSRRRAELDLLAREIQHSGGRADFADPDGHLWRIAFNPQFMPDN